MELDELWSDVGKKQKGITPIIPADLGDNTSLSGSTRTSRRSSPTASVSATARTPIFGGGSSIAPRFHRTVSRQYLEAVERSFGADCSYGQVIKLYHGEPAIDTARRYSPGAVVGVRRHRLIGHQRRVCTSYVERGNLGVRMASRRFTRLTNGFSKKLANHVAAVSLYVAHFNLCRIHESLRITPAMAMGITDHIWSDPAS